MGAFRMSDLSFFDPPIEIAAESPRLEVIASRLRASGMRPYPASAPIDFSAPDPLLIDIGTATRSTLEALSRAAMVQVHRPVVLLDTASAHLPNSGETIILRRDQDLAALKARLTALARRASRVREAEALLDPELVSVAQLAEQMGMNVRALERLSRRAFGFPPKLLLRRQRFLRSLARFMIDPSLGWLGALDCHYHDQSHFVRDFRRFMGMNTSAYAKADKPILVAAARGRMAIAGEAVQGLHRAPCDAAAV